jgi:hypothetical protein
MDFYNYKVNVGDLKVGEQQWFYMVSIKSK